MKTIGLLIMLCSLTALAEPSPVENLSANYLKAAKNGGELLGIKKELLAVSLDEITQELKDDDSKKAFSLNIYNAYVFETLKFTKIAHVFFQTLPSVFVIFALPLI